MVADGSGGDQGYIGINKGSGNGLTFGEQNRDFIWQTGNSTPFNGTERMRLTNAGNLGLGTTAPVSLLNVLFNASTRNGITVTNAYEPGAPAYIAFKGYDWVRSAIWHDRSSGLPLQFAINPNTSDLTINGCVVAASFDTSGSLLVGTTSTSGSTSNYSSLLAGVFKSFSGNTSLTPTNTYTTLFTDTGNFGSYIVTVWIYANDVSNYQSVVIVSTQPGTSTKVNVIVSSGLLAFQMSGYSLQCAQQSGASQTIYYSAIRIAG
jgi:hypothetical protein